MTLAAPASPTPPRSHRFTAEQYHRMAESGVLKESDRVELLNGEIIDMSPIGKEHSAVVDRLLRFLRDTDPDTTIIRIQSPILMDDTSEPEPDLTMLRFRGDYYGERLPGPGDVLLLIEVSDTSLDMDRKVKIPLYAGAGIPEVWLVDIKSKSIEVFREPSDGQFRQHQIFKRPASIAPGAFSRLTLKLEAILP